VTGWDAAATFTRQGESILPIMEDVVTNACGQVVCPMTVTGLNAAGERVEFEMLGPPKRMNEPAIPLKVRVLARQIGGELPADTHSLDRPEGWSKWDGRTRDLLVVAAMLEASSTALGQPAYKPRGVGVEGEEGRWRACRRRWYRARHAHTPHHRSRVHGHLPLHRRGAAGAPTSAP